MKDIVICDGAQKNQHVSYTLYVIHIITLVLNGFGDTRRRNNSYLANTVSFHL